MGGDGATYDIGFGALSRLLAHLDADQGRGAQQRRVLEHRRAGIDRQPDRPGRRSRRFGAAHHGKQEDRKELGLIAAFHPNVFVVQTCAALQGHFLKNVMEYLNHNDSPAVLDVYTPCQAEHGIADAAGEPSRPDGGGEPHEPGVRARSAPRRRPARAVLARRQSRRRQGLGDQHASNTSRTARPSCWKCRSPRPTSRDRRPLQEAVPHARRRRRRRAGARVHRPERGRSARQDAVHLVDRRRQEADQAGGVADAHPPGRRSAGNTGGPCNI